MKRTHLLLDHSLFALNSSALRAAAWMAAMRRCNVICLQPATLKPPSSRLYRDGTSALAPVTGLGGTFFPRFFVLIASFEADGNAKSIQHCVGIRRLGFN